MLSNPVTYPALPANDPPRRTMLVSPAEEKLLERLRNFKTAMLVTLFVGGDGEPKELFAYEGQREVLAR